MAAPAVGSFVYKFILIGNSGVGKTAAAQSFANGKPNATTQYKMTIGVDYAVRELTIGKATASVQMWDIAGEQRFGTMTKTYFRGAHAAIIMFDLTNAISWEDVDIWRQDVNMKLGSLAADIPILVVGNKLDLIDDNRHAVVNQESLNRYVAQHNLWKGIMLSARSDNVFGETVAEMAQLVHINSPSKAITPAEQKLRQTGSLRVLTPKSPMETRTESPKRSRSGSSSNNKGVLAASSSSAPHHSNDDDDHVFTHTDEPNEGKADCCVIS